MKIKHIKIVSNNTTEFKFIFHKDKFRIKSLIIDPSVQNYSPVKQLQISEAAYKLQKSIYQILLSKIDNESLQKNIDSLRDNTVRLFNVVFSIDINLIIGPSIVFELNDSLQIGTVNPEVFNKIEFFSEVSSCDMKNKSIYCREFMFKIN
jgi:hypothetical protein